MYPSTCLIINKSLSAENSTKVHIQGCFTGINFWVQHLDQNIKLTTETNTEIVITKNEYKIEIKSFADKVKEFYKTSKPKQIPKDNYDRIGYEMMWNEWNLIRNKNND
jgi:hypothetical protein